MATSKQTSIKDLLIQETKEEFKKLYEEMERAGFQKPPAYVWTKELGPNKGFYAVTVAGLGQIEVVKKDQFGNRSYFMVFPLYTEFIAWMKDNS